MKWLIEHTRIKKILIICKKSIKKQWSDEFDKFTDLRKDFVITYTGPTPTSRKKAYRAIEEAEKGILITNYHTFLNDTSYISDLNFEFFCIDEVHEVKARQGIINHNIASVAQGKPTLFLTGTPIMSKPEDIYGIVQIARPEYFGTWTEFRKKYLTIDVNGKFGPRIVGAKNLDELRAKIQDIVIRRTEYEVAIELPQVVLQKKECEMDKTQESIVLEIQKTEEAITSMLEGLKKTQQQTGMTPAIESARARLEANSKALIAAKQAACSDPRMFRLSSSEAMKNKYGVIIPKNYKMSPKSEAIVETVEDIVSSGNKVILFSKFRTCAQLIAGDITRFLKIKTLLYTGAENEEQRNEAFDLFCNDPDYNVMIGTEAMSAGLNLQVAKFIINIDQPDTFALKTQRIGRVRRIGSAYSNVVIYDMITTSTAKAHSKDEERLNNIINNQNLTDALITLDEAQRQALIEAMKGE